MNLSQKRFSLKTSFQFKNEELKYHVKDRSGSSSYTIPYTSISDSFSEIEERQDWYRNVGVLWMIIGLVLMFYNFSNTGEFSFSIWLILGTGLLVTYRVVTIKYTILETERGGLVVVKDNQHDKILSEIEKRRKTQLYNHYGKINFSNDPNDEINKFKWLLEIDAIDKIEYEKNIKEICRHHNISNIEFDGHVPRISLN